MALPVSTLSKEGAYEAAKWLKVPVLADAAEFESLFALLGSFDLYPLSGVQKRGDVPLSKQVFLDAVQSWIEQLKRGEAPSSEQLRKVLACGLSASPDCLWLQEVGEDRYLVKIRRPIIQIQAHFFTYSAEQEAFHSMVLGKESVFWGVQFSYPQIFMDPSQGDLCKVDDSFENTALFQQIRRWSRDATRATPFIASGKKINVPIRLGKRCFSWIHAHPQLAARGLAVGGEHVD